MGSIAIAQSLESIIPISAVSLLFPAGGRPAVSEIRELAQNCPSFSISFDPSDEGDAENAWVELLANGLTFDLTGLGSSPVGPVPRCEHLFGLQPDFRNRPLEAITLQPGPHLAAGSTMYPVVRCMALLAAELAALARIEAVAWHPARACSAADLFRRGVLGWIGGGAFPGLGLAALVSMSDGSLQSEGLATFTGQELLLPAEMCHDQAQAAKIALRVLNWLVEHGRVEEQFSFTGPGGETLLLEPVGNSGIVRLWRVAQ
ncbi:MAG: hypothetical protein JY451_14655 [Erythrobacter sp.]|nr:MAG: hypothetical protein JY451_14655 [Erythrobacter sp.]